jgi:catechol 2,3-dioxygenase-like lactoylglutathione lyase family enzyme
VIDHVTLRVSDFQASNAFYSTVLAPLGHELGWEDARKRGAEWGDFSIAQDEKPLSENVHVAFVAKNRDEVDAFHRVAMDAGYRDNGPAGERPSYHEDYYGAFVLDPDGSNIEAVHHGIEPAFMFDHLFLRVRDLEASRRFYELVGGPFGFGLWTVDSENDWVALGKRTHSLWLTEGAPTQNLHFAFGAQSREEVDAFHKTAVEAGYRDNGTPGERPIYHEGYYGAFVLDPDGNNVEAVFHDRA